MMLSILREIRVLAFLAVHALAWNDLPRAVQGALGKSGLSAANFSEYIASLDRSTAQRVREGESDHLIFFVLQSRVFTARPRIEPALSARALVDSLSTGERACYLSEPPCEISSRKIPPGARARLNDFAAALHQPTVDERMLYFRGLAQSGIDLQAGYLRAMRFLYLKEFVLNERPGAVNALYSRRGHSTDTSLAANYAVWNALSVLRGAEPGVRLDRVLLIGPGLDIAPRTGLVDSISPQSYQPFALMDALSPDARIHCVDINPRVIRFLENFQRHPRLFFVPESGDPDYEAYARNFGTSIGKRTPATLLVRADVAERITAEELNIVTQRPVGNYDLAVATNVLLYFEGNELLLALSNIASVLKPGGYLIHNDLRPELDSMAQMAGLHPIAARTVRIASGKTAPLYDSFAIYRK